MSGSGWFLYMIETRQGHLYTGITTDVERRFNEHQNSPKKGAKYLRGKGPLTLVYQTKCADRSAASKLESEIKKLSRQQKLVLINCTK